MGQTAEETATGIAEINPVTAANPETGTDNPPDIATDNPLEATDEAQPPITAWIITETSSTHCIATVSKHHTSPEKVP